MVGSISTVSGFNVPTTTSASSNSSNQNNSSTASSSSQSTADSGFGTLSSSEAATVLGSYSNLQNPNLASSGSGTATSLLGAYSGDSSFFGSMPTQQSQLFTEIEQTAATRFSDKQTTIQNTYQQVANFVQAQTNKWITVKANINNVNASIQTNQTSLTTIGNTLLSMRGTVSLASEKSASAQSEAKVYNQALASMNLEANKLGQSFNLIGSVNPYTWQPNTISYNNTVGIGTTTLTGSNAGSDYRIVSSDGSVWIPDTIASTLDHYSGLGGEQETVTVTDGTNTANIPEAASYTNGIQLVSYDPTTNAITLNITINPSDPPETVTGTLQRTGTGLMPAWFYNNFTTQAGQQQAFKDINAAQVQLTSVGATVQSAAGTVGVDSEHADQAINALASQQNDAQGTELKQLQNLQVQYQQQVQAMQANLSSLSSEQQNYLDAFASQISSDPYLSVTV